MKKNHLARAIVFKAVATLGVAGVLSSCVARLNAPVPLEPGAGLPVIVQSSPSPVAPAGFSITPLTTVLATGSNTSFMAVGGEAPYTYDVYYGAGAIDPATGAYTAPVSPGTATVRALDADGSTAYATVEITDAPVIDPSSVTVAVGNRYRFSVQGGKGPYSFGVASGLGTVSATGEYAAPATATTAVVRVTDSVGRSSDSTVTVSAALAISPKTGSVPVSGTLDLSAAGGVGEKSFTLLSGDGAVDPVTGLFTAPPVTGMAAIKVQDELGNVDVAILTINNPLRINPPSLSLARGSSFAFSASGGRPPYTYFVPVTDDGSINSSTGAYTAPSSTGLAIITVRDNLGQEASSVVTVTESLEFLSPNLTLMVGDEVTFSAQGGTPGYFFSVPSSGFTGAGATYTAQAAGTYLVDVSDSQIPSANTAQASVVVNPLLTISPAAVTLAVGNAWAFSASGGIPPYTYSPSGGSINASTGAFTAPATVPAGGTVTVTVTDAGGHPASATVTVNAALSISPATKTLVANGAHTFVTAGGVPPYTYTVSSGGGAVNSATGAYVAPAGVGTAIVRVSDSLGNVSEASVSVVAPLAITPSTMMLLKGTQMPFAASGGLAPYTFAVISGQGDVEASAGLYEAPSAAGTATVRVSDALGGSAEAAVTIYDGLTISPFTKVLAVNGSATFSASGGLAPYAYSVHSGGGSITASGGAYTAPAAPGVATIRVTDAAFNTSDATVTINPALAISVAQNPIAVGNVTSFAATGGVPPYVFTVQSGGGAINASTGDYTAPAAPATVVVRVTDSAVPVAFIDTSLTVNGAVAISPLTAQLVTSGTQVFTASGGAGGYTFSVSSGGGSFTGGTYTAPASPGNVIVRATDILGNYSEAPITVYAPLVLTPATKELAVNNSFTFIASGGVQPYTYSKVSGEGTFAAGVYQAPVAAGSGSAVIKVTDSAGNEDTSTVTIQGALAITPLSPTLAAGGGQLFSATGGVLPYAYQVVSGGGSFSGATLTAPSTASGASVLVRVSDALGNDATTTVTVPAISVAIGSPSAGAYVTATNKAAFPVSGSCTEIGRAVAVAGPGGASSSPSCLAGGTWSTTLDLSGAPEGATTITANHQNVNAVVAAQASVTVNKDTGVPVLLVSEPTSGGSITAASQSAVIVSGSCSENGRAVNVTAPGGPSAAPLCSEGGFSTSLNFTSVSDGAITITVNHSDVAGNAATQISLSLTKDAGVPTVAISAPLATSYINLANRSAVIVSGTCSENDRAVNLTATGSLSASPNCSSGSFSATFDFTAVSDGAITISATHGDTAGNSASASVSLTKDAVAPTSISIGAPTEGAYIAINDQDTVTLSGSCSEAGTDNVVVKAGVTTLGAANCAASVFSGVFDLSALSGAQSLTAVLSDAAGNSTTSSAVGIHLGGLPSKLVVSGASSAQAGVCSGAIAVTTKDEGNNVAAVTSELTVNLTGNGAGTFYSDSGCSSSITSVAIAAAGSSAQFYFKSTTAESLILSAADAAAGLTTGTYPFTVSVGAAAKLSFSAQPTNATAGAAIAPQVQVTVQDAHGNTVTGSSAEIALAIGTNPASGTLSGTATRNASSGIATFDDLSVNKAGVGYTLVASSASLTSATSSAFTISAGAAAKLAFIVEPSGAAPGGTISPAVQVAVQDALGNTVTASSAAVTLAIGTNPGSGMLSGTNPVNASSGVASFSDLSIDLGGIGYTLTASSPSLTSATSAAFNMVRPSSLTASASVVPSDGLAQATISVIPRSGTDGSLMGTGQTIEVTVSSSNVTLSGAGDCRVPAATCVKATDLGGGAYGVTAVSSTPGSYTFSGVIAETPDRAIVQTASVTFDTSQFTQISANTTITSAGHGGRNLYFTGGMATFDTTTAGVTFGHIYVNGGVLTHLTSAPTTVKKLDIRVTSLTLQGGSINANGLGYWSGYSYASSGSSTALGSGGNRGASHGGKGGLTTSSIGPTYGDYRDPVFPGASQNYAGGGVIRIIATEGCVIQSGTSINADGGGAAAAGGSVSLRCASFSGNAGASAVTANGGNGTVSWAGGGGGRVALVSTGDENSFAGSFRFPVDAASLASIKTVVKALGGTGVNATYPGGGAGTIYLKHSGLVYGDLIVDNGGQVNYDNTGKTSLVSMAGIVSSAPGASTLPVTVASSPALSAAYDNLYTGMSLRPDLSFTNGTAGDWTDDNILKVASNTSTTLTMTGGFAGVPSGASFRSIDILDHIDVAGAAAIQTNGDLYVLSGSISAPGTGNLALENAFVECAGTNLVLNTTLSSGIFTYGTLTADALTISGATVTATNVNVTQNLTQTAGSLTATNVTVGQNYSLSGGTATLQNLTTTGDLALSGAAVLKHPATTNTVVYKLQANVGGNLSLNGTSSINVSSLGYPGYYSYGATGPSTSLAAGTNAAGSHGGKGVDRDGPAGPVYGDYRDPSLPGGGAYAGDPGGGVVRVTANGTCTLNSGTSITASPTTGQGAGGSIYLRCAAFSGNAGASAITANGGNASSARPGGGGGRIALISTGDASSFSGSFAYPMDATTSTNFKAVLKAKGGTPYNSSIAGGGAGTIYLKHSGLVHGDLIIDNGGNTHYNTSGRTPLVSMAGTVNGAPGANSLPVTVTSTPALTAAYANLYAGMRLRPDLAFSNGTANDWLDDNILTVASNNATTLTMTGNFAGVGSGASFRSIDILDHLEVSGGAWVQSNGDVYVLNGSLSAPSPTAIALTNSFMEFLGTAGANLFVDSVLSSGTYSLGTYNTHSLLISGATLTATDLNVSQDLSQTSGTLTATNVTVSGNHTASGGTATIQNLNVTGNWALSGSAIVKHPATTTTTVNRLQATVGGTVSLDGTSSINADSLGYPAGYSFGASGPSITLSSNTGNTGASHGGKGATASTVGPTYGDYRNPSWPGGGGWSSVLGGGVIRITAGGACTINSGATIKANAGLYAAAGGSIYLRCAGFSGTAAASALTANGSNASGSSFSGGGGGRIALISTGDATTFSGSFAYPTDSASLSGIKNVVKALGGAPSNSNYAGGGAGTIYLKHSGLQYGDLIIDNGGQLNYEKTGKTFLPSLAGTVNGSPGSNTLPVTVTSTPALAAAYANLYAGMTLRPDLAFTNGTASNWADDNVLAVQSNDATTLTMTGAFGGVASGASFRSIDIVDHLDIGGGALVQSNGDLYALSGPISAPGSASMSLTNSLVDFLGSAQTNLVFNTSFTAGTYNIPALVLDSLNFSGATLVTPSLSVAQTLSQSSGTLTATTVNVGQDYAFSGGTATITDLTTGGSFDVSGGTIGVTNATVGQNYTQSAGTATLQNLTTTGDLALSGNAILKHPATTTTAVYKLQATVGSNFTMNGTSSINVKGLGYTYGRSYGATGPSTALASASGCGGSHGGRGGKYSANTPGAVFDDYRNPSWPGGGGSGSYQGGGVARLIVTGSCTINSGSSINANAALGGANWEGAGGSIYLNCASIGGTAGASALTAKGGDANTSVSGGGGGMIALISTGDASSFTGSFAYPVDSSSLSAIKAVIKANGGDKYSSAYPGGGAGTIYLKHSGLAHGDLIIDNAGQTNYANTGATEFVAATDNASTIFNFPDANTAQITAASTPFTNKTDIFAGQLLHVYPISGGSADPYDVSRIPATITSNGTNTLVSSGNPFPTGGADNSYLYRFVVRLDHLDIAGNANVNLNGADLMLEASGADACDLHSGVATKLDVPAGSSLTGNTIASEFCSSAAVSGSVTFSNNFLAP